MTEYNRNQKILWAIGTVVVLLYALTPVAWIVSLSFKDPTTIGDQKFLPTTKFTWDNYSAVFQKGLGFNHALINSIGIAHHHRAGARAGVDGGVRDHAPGLPGQDADPRRLAGGLDVPGDLDRRRPVQRLARRRPL